MIQIAVVGLGRVGSQNDTDGALQSHVACVLATPGLRLAAVIDPSEQAREAFRKKWRTGAETRVLSQLGELARGEADVIALCTPPSGREPLATNALEKAPKLLVLEKPIAGDAAEARAIETAAEKLNVPMRVNFHRRFDPKHRALQQSLPGTPRQVVMRFGKGLFNYGTHLIDLLIGWFGPAMAVQALSPLAGGDDSALTFRVRMQTGFDAILIGMEGLSYDQFEIDLFYSDSRVEIANGGTQMRQYPVIADRFYKGYPQLGPAVVIGADGPVGGLAEFYQAIRDHLAEGKVLAGCDARQAIVGLDILEAARESARQGGLEIALAEQPPTPEFGRRNP